MEHLLEVDMNIPKKLYTGKRPMSKLVGNLMVCTSDHFYWHLQEMWQYEMLAPKRGLVSLIEIGVHQKH
jgi:hypothetical protein